MFVYNKKMTLFGIGLVMLIGIGSKLAFTPDRTEGDKKFNAHWNDGNAEVCSYELWQNRYGALREGDAVLIYVTEDFSRSKQVKLDRPEENKKDGVKVLKLNTTKEFRTGIYPYHLMASVFTEVETQKTLKATHAVQEWCGHTYSQFNREENGYKVRRFSYFESEGDTEEKLPEVLLEDEIWTLLRLNPSSVPEGKQKIIQSGLISRLKHTAINATDVHIHRADTIWEGRSASSLAVQFSDRKLVIYHEKKLPYTILGWEETYSENGDKLLVSKAKLKQQKRIPYWKLNKISDLGWRDSLGLHHR